MTITNFKNSLLPGLHLAGVRQNGVFQSVRREWKKIPRGGGIIFSYYTSELQYESYAFCIERSIPEQKGGIMHRRRGGFPWRYPEMVHKWTTISSQLFLFSGQTNNLFSWENEGRCGTRTRVGRTRGVGGRLADHFLSMQQEGRHGLSCGTDPGQQSDTGVFLKVSPLAG